MSNFSFRNSKNHKTHIIAFVGSPITADVEADNGKHVTGGSNLVTISSEPHLTDSLLSSPMVKNEDSSFPILATGGGDFEFADPSEDAGYGSPNTNCGTSG